MSAVDAPGRSRRGGLIETVLRARPGRGPPPPRQPPRRRVREPAPNLPAAAAAAGWLKRRAQHDSAAFGPSPFQIGLLLALSGAALPAVVLAPAASWSALCAVAAIAFAAGIALRIAALTTPPPTAAPTRRAPARALPVYTVIAPLYREANVVGELVDSLRRIDYPPERLDIKIVLEADDFSTQRVVRELALDASFELLIVPPGQPRTKPRALNYALAFARGDYVVVYDAEDRPAPNQLRAALAAFQDGPARLASVQAPLGWWNAEETWITRQFALEYAAQFHVMLPALAHWGCPFPLGGTSNHFRRDALVQVGAWDPHNVTEDADIGFRLAAHGWRLGVIAPPTDEEAPTGFKPWRLQRTRWIKGFMQTWGVRTRRPLSLARGAGYRGLLALPLTLGLAIASSFLHGPLAIWTALSLLLSPWEPGWALERGPALIFLLAGYAAAAAAMALGLKRAGLARLTPHMLLTPFYWPLQTWAAITAAGELVWRPFHWQKTRHGRTRMSAPPPSGPSR